MYEEAQGTSFNSATKSSQRRTAAEMSASASGGFGTHGSLRTPCASGLAERRGRRIGARDEERASARGICERPGARACEQGIRRAWEQEGSRSEWEQALAGGQPLESRDTRPLVPSLRAVR